MKWAEEQLRQAGLRITQHRMDVLDWLRACGKPVTFFELNRFFSTKINRITLYRILNDLTDAGMLKMFYGQDGHKYIEEGSPSFEGMTKEDHSHVHFQCNSCDEVFCLDNVEVKNLPKGFNVSPAQSILIGLCERCH